MFRRFCRLALVVAALACLGGCVSTSISKEDRAAIRSVHLVQPMAVNPDPMVFTRGQGFAMATAGLFGLAATAGVAEDGKNAFLSYLAFNRIDLDQMLTDELAAQLKAAGIQVAPQSEANASLSTEVKAWGIAYTPNMFNGQYRLLIRFNSTLTAPDQRVLWEKSVYDSSYNSERPSATLEELMGNPQTMREHMRVLVKTTAKELFEDFGAEVARAQ